MVEKPTDDRLFDNDRTWKDRALQEGLAAFSKAPADGFDLVDGQGQRTMNQINHEVSGAGSKQPARSPLVSAARQEFNRSIEAARAAREAEARRRKEEDDRRLNDLMHGLS